MFGASVEPRHGAVAGLADLGRFSVIATGNHYWLDVVAGFALALLDRART